MATLHDLSQLPATLSLLSSPVVRGRARVRRPGRAEPFQSYFIVPK